MSSIANLLGINSLKTKENTPAILNDKSSEQYLKDVSTEYITEMTYDEQETPEQETSKQETPEQETSKQETLEQETSKQETLEQETSEQKIPNPVHILSKLSTVKNDMDDDEPKIEENENIPDIGLKTVSELQEVLGEMKYEDVRKGLYKKYGLITKDEPSVPGLYMITYNKPDKNSSKNKVVITNDQQNIVSQYRGIIVEKNTNKPVCYTFDKMDRHFPDETKLTDYKITASCDGSQIKTFFYKQSNRWVVSTTRRIDAAHSYFFSNKSFMEMFQDASSSLDWNKLNKKCCYSFVLAHPDNKVVARHNKPFLTHVLTRNMETYNIVDDDIGVSKAQVVTFNEKSDIWKSINHMPYYKEGYVANNGNTFIKLVNSKYQEVKELRGNSSSLLFHYFHLKKHNKIRQFLSYYPESTETFKYFNNCFHNLCVLAYNEYILLRVRKLIQPPQILHFLKPVLYKLHGIHIKTKSRIHLVDVQKHLEEYPPFILRKLIDMANGLPYTFV